MAFETKSFGFRLFELSLGLLLLCWSPLIFAQSELPVSKKQSAELANIELLPDQVKEGLKGIAIKFDVNFAFEGREIFNKEDTYQDYDVYARLFDRSRQKVAANLDAIPYRDLDGYCRDSIMIRLGNVGKLFKDEVMFIPYHAIALDSGAQRLQIQLSLVTKKDNAVLAKSAFIDLNFRKPNTQLVRIGVRDIWADSTDLSGEPWDFKFLNPRDVGPDLYWTLRRGTHIIQKSEKQKNQIKYIGDISDFTSWIQISEGDLLYFSVFDFDLLGYSDVAGNLTIDVNSDTIRNHTVNELRFESIRSSHLQIDRFVPGRIQITDLALAEAAEEKGVQGLSISFKYDVKDLPKDAIGMIKFAFLNAEKQFSPKFLRIVKGQAVRIESDLIELTSGKGNLELFIPHFAIPQNMSLEQSQYLELIPVLQFGKQQIEYPREIRQVILPENVVQDLKFGQWKFSEARKDGAGGLRITLDYQLPGAYLDDMPDAEITILPKIGGSFGDIPNNHFFILGKNESFWNVDRLRITNENRQGTLEMFIPFHFLPNTVDEVQISATYLGLMKVDSSEIRIGEISRQAAADFPSLQMMHIAVKEVAAKKEAWMITNPNLFWVLKVGEEEVFRSPVVYNRKEAKWADAVEFKMVAAPDDILELQILHEGVSGEEDRVIESWKGTASLVPNRPRGATHLHTETLKKLLIRSYWDD